jgi:LuxR family maltose regulon positive regulatory protein
VSTRRLSASAAGRAQYVDPQLASASRTYAESASLEAATRFEAAERHLDQGIAFGSVLVGQGRPGEAEAWVQRAERTVTEDAEPAARLAVQYSRGRLELGRGRVADALAAFRAADRLADRLDAPNLLLARARAMLLYILARLGDTEAAEQILVGFGSQDRERGEIRIAAAALRLAQGNPSAAAVTLAPVLDGSASALPWGWLPHAFLLEAIAQDALGDPVAAGRALERPRPR